MQQRVTKRDEQDSNALLAQLAAATLCVGQAAFYRKLLVALGERLHAHMSMVMRYSRRRAPEYLIHDGLQPDHMALYLRGLYRVDPIYRLCRQQSPQGAQGVQDLATVSTPAERSGEYFNVFLRLTGMADDLVILLPVDSDVSIGMVYERKTIFEPHEISAMKIIYPLIRSLHRVHQRLSGSPSGSKTKEMPSGHAVPADAGLVPIDHKAALGTFLRGELTPRERDIVHLVLLGYPTVRIAERLKLSPNTVKNHKKRMYRKLDITTERELFLAFVNFLITGAIGQGPYGVHWQ